MSETEHDKPEDELELTPETVEDLDADGDDVKGGVPTGSKAPAADC